jgi:ATP-binding cassette subfamily C protein
MLDMKKSKIFLALIILLSVFSGITGLVYSYVVRIVIEGINNPESFKFRIIISIILMALTIVITYFREILIGKYIKIYNITGRDSLFKARLQNNSKEEYISILINDVNTVESEYIKAKFDLITCIVMFVFAWGNLMLYSWIHGLIILVFAISSVSISMILRGKARKYRFAISKSQEVYTHRVKDMLLGITVIKQFSALEHICLAHHRENENLETTKFKNSIFLAKMEAIGSVFSMSMFYISFLLGAFFVIRGTYTIAIMMAAIQLVNNIVSPMFEGVSSINCINGSSEIMAKIKQFSKIDEQQWAKILAQ